MKLHIGFHNTVHRETGSSGLLTEHQARPMEQAVGLLD